MIPTLLLLLCGLCYGEDKRPVIDGVYACGFLSQGSTSIGIIETEYGFKAITPGQKLGDYTVHTLSADGPFVFTVEGEEQVAEWTNSEVRASSGSGNIQVRLEDVNCLEASQALAKLMGDSFFCDPTFAGSVSLRGAFEESELWPTLVAAGEGSTFDGKRVGNDVLICAPEKVARVEAALKQDFRKDRLVTLDFTHAELAYVLNILAENELNLEARIPSNLDGGVTITARNTPASALLEASLALQDKVYKVVWGPQSVIVEED